MSSWGTQVHQWRRYNSICAIHAFADRCCRVIVNIPSKLKLAVISESVFWTTCFQRSIILSLFPLTLTLLTVVLFFSVIVSFFILPHPFFWNIYSTISEIRAVVTCLEVLWSELTWSTPTETNIMASMNAHGTPHTRVHWQFLLHNDGTAFHNHCNQKTVQITLTTAAWPYKVGTLMMWSTCVVLSWSPTGWRKLLCFSRSSF